MKRCYRHNHRYRDCPTKIRCLWGGLVSTVAWWLIGINTKKTKKGV